MARGGKRAGAGRPVGSRNAASADQIADIAAAARAASGTALAALVQIAGSGSSESARVSAASAILDRAFGRPQLAVEIAGPEGGPIQIENRGAEKLAAFLNGIAERSGTTGETEPE